MGVLLMFYDALSADATENMANQLIKMEASRAFKLLSRSRGGREICLNKQKLQG
jgi:hypothetical protein